MGLFLLENAMEHLAFGPKMTVRTLINGTVVIYLDKDCDPDLLIAFAKGLKDE